MSNQTNRHFHAAPPLDTHACRAVRRRGRWHLYVGLFILAVSCAASRPAVAWQGPDEAVINREYPLKALFLYNFGSYVEWPTDTFSDPQDPFVIGVLGTAPLEKPLQGLASNKTIAGRKIVVEFFPTAEAIKPCQILFIARSVNVREQRLAMQKLRNQPVLIVGESDGFVGQGGSVNFFIEANKIRFEINPETVKQRELKLSSKLLSLARIVESE